MPALRHRQGDLLQVAKAISGARPGGPSRPVHPTASLPVCHQRGGDRQDRLLTPELPLWALQARDVPQALPPAGHQRVRDLAHPEAPEPEPAPRSQRYKPHKERWKLYEKPQPGNCLQVDVKFISPLAGHHKRLYQYTAIDDCTRLRVLRIYERLNQKTAIQFIDLVLDRLPFKVETVQTDNGGEFQSSFHWHLRDRGIRHVYIKPLMPRMNGKVERSHRIDDEEFYQLLEGVVVDDAAILNAKLREWEQFYNFERPHAALAGQTPYERLRQKTGLSVSGDTVS